MFGLLTPGLPFYNNSYTVPFCFSESIGRKDKFFLFLSESVVCVNACLSSLFLLNETQPVGHYHYFISATIDIYCSKYSLLIYTRNVSQGTWSDIIVEEIFFIWLSSPTFYQRGFVHNGWHLHIDSSDVSGTKWTLTF